jgi:hypothetical protein
MVIRRLFGGHSKVSQLLFNCCMIFEFWILGLGFWAWDFNFGILILIFGN